MTKKELKKRWKGDKGQQLLGNILKGLKGGENLAKIKGIEKHVGRWDLRGAPLSELWKEKKTIADKNHTFTQKFGTLRLKNLKLESIDFSYSDISYSWWQNCRVSNCIFEETKGKELRIYGSDFDDCIFKRVDLTYSYLNINIGKNSGSFKRVNFVECNLKECIFSFPKIENCLFENCNLLATNFDGSRFKNCRFLGEVDSPWFSGYSTTAQRSLFGFFNKVNPRDFPNSMENVDFSQATLIGVSFINEIDLSKCHFPKDESRYIIIKNLKEVYSQARQFITNNWKDEDLRKGIGFIEKVLFIQNRQNQQMDLIDKQLLCGDSDIEFGEKFFSLLKYINNKMGANK